MITSMQSPTVFKRRSIDHRHLHRILLLLMLTAILPLPPTRVPTPSELAIPPAKDASAIPPVLQSSTPSDIQAPPYALPSELVGKPEVVARRTANSATFDMGNGQYALLQDILPLHYQDDKGAWQPINPAFAAVSGGWANTTNTLQTSLAQRSSSAKVGTDAVGVGWEPQALLAVSRDDTSEELAKPLGDAQAAPGIRSADGRTVRYTKSWSDARLQDQWHSNPGSAEYSMRLESLPSVRDTIPQNLDVRVLLHLRPGTTIQVGGKAAVFPLETSEAISFTDAQGKAMLLQPPQVYEQSDAETRTSGTYKLLATDDPSVVELRVRFGWSWLSAKERQFPIIIDPMFQTRGPTTARSILYPNDGNPPNYYSNPLQVGPYNNGVSRIQIRFDMPSMPPNTVINNAYLSATPNDISLVNRDYGSANVLLYSLTYGDVNNGGKPPDPKGTQLIGSKSIRYSRGEQVHYGGTWDVMALAQNWLDNPQSNYGVLLRTEREQCKFSPKGCLGFSFDPRGTWTEQDLASTERSIPSDPYTPSSNSGIRLLVFYNGPTLTETREANGSVQGPLTVPSPSSDSNYYHAYHDYEIPPVPGDRWQAITVRGLGPGTKLLTQTIQPLQGALPAELRAGDDARALRPLPQNPGEVNYALLNGRRNSGAAYRLRVQPPPQSLPPASKPLTYEVRLQGEAGTIDNSAALPPEGRSAEVTNYTFNSGDPLALWNVQLPANSNNRVAITISASNPDFASLKNNFKATIINGDTNQPAISPFNQNSQIFAADASRYALALAYNGPQVYAGPPGPGVKANPQVAGARKPTQTPTPTSTPSPVFVPPPTSEPPKLEALTFTVNVRIISCSSNPGGFPFFPTSGGTCQQVKCPTSSSQGYKEPDKIGLGLWSPSGWNSTGTDTETVYPGTAPLIGGINQAAPTVAVIGGRVSYTAAGSMQITGEAGSPSDVLLIDCGALGDTEHAPANYFDAFQGEMQLSQMNSAAVLVPNPELPNLKGVPNFDPWFGTRDYTDLSNEKLSINPTTGIAGGEATLKRELSNTTPITSTNFLVNWSLNVQGWPSFTSSVSNPQSGSIGIAGLSLTLNSGFSLDVSVPGQERPLSVDALRISDATITQPYKLGGASKPVQALISPRGTPLKDARELQCAASCIDLRALNDTPEQPNRTWAMPDVRTRLTPGTVLMSSKGGLLAFSKDHPAAMTGGVSAEFSYDAFGASVSITIERCDDKDQNAPEVTVVRGETSIALPNLGSSTDADAMISASFKLCQTSLRQVRMEFSSAVGIPIASTGLFMTGLNGTVDIYDTYTTISFGLDFQAAQGTDGGTFKGSGTVTIDTRGLFAFQGKGKVLGKVDADGKLWVAWNPLDIGFDISVSYGDWLKGFARAHMWKGQGWQNRYTWLPANNETHLAAQITATITIPKGAIFKWAFIKIPSDDIPIYGVEVAFGQFCTSDNCTSYEWGIKGKLTVVGYDVGLYYGFDKGFDFILGNDDHVLIDQYGGAEPAPLAQVNGTPTAVQVRAAPQQVGDTALVPLTVKPEAENLMFALGWQAGAPRLSLITPDGAEITKANAAQYSAVITGTMQSTIITVQAPTPGAWQAKISNLSASRIEHYKFAYFANKGAPGTPGNRGQFLTPSQADENGTGRYTITWNAPPDAPVNSTISLYSRITIPITEATSRVQNLPIVQNFPFRTGKYVWDTEGVGNGSYQIYAVVDDGVNSFPDGSISNPDNACVTVGSGLPSARAFDPNRFPGTSIFTATGTIAISDTTPPSPPSGLTLTGIDSAALARWNLNAEKDIAAYVVSWGPRTGDSFTPENQQRVTAVQTPTLRIGGLNNGTSYGVNIAAIDVNGNTSAPTSPIFVIPDGTTKPIPFAPTNFTVTAVLAGGASFSWSAADGPIPAGYRLTYTQLGAIRTNGQLDTTATNATISGLQPGATYDVWVSAANSDGWRSASAGPVRVVVTNGVDSDGDGLPDDWAKFYGVSGAAADSDGDGLSNAAELAKGTDPTKQSSDADDFSDFEEVQAGTDPLNGTIYGAELLQPRLTLSSDRVEFEPKLQTTEPITPAVIIWSNTGGGNLQLEATADRPWIKPSIISNTVQISLDPTMLEPGFYTGIVRLRPTATSDPLIGKPSCIRVTVWASPPDNGFNYRRYLPLTESAPIKLAALPDLVGSFTITPNKKTFAAGERVQITATITNTGAVAAEPFWVDLYINPSTPPTAAGVRWNDVCGLKPCQGIAWAVKDGLAPGQSITLTSTAQSYDPAQTIWHGWFANGTKDLYLYVDSWNPGVATGAVLEGNESNNRAELHGLTVTGKNPTNVSRQQVTDLPPRPVLPHH